MPKTEPFETCSKRYEAWFEKHPAAYRSELAAVSGTAERLPFPDRYMDRAVKRGAQIICATHEFMFWERARFIELRRGYRNRIGKAVCRIKCFNEQEDLS